MTSTIAHKGFEVDAIDLFCGYGGSSQGIHKAGATVKVAANHNPLAIDTHAANYPDVDHRRADLSNPDAADYIDPQDLPSARFLWASPSCKHHSKANAQKLYAQGPGAELNDDEEERYANSERSRVTMLCPIRYAAKHRPEIVVIENVVEAAKWGPNQDGSTFRWWLNEWTKLGYVYECKFLNSMFFPPCPQSRDRMYVVLWLKGNKAPDLDHRPTAMCTNELCVEDGKVVDAVQTWKKRTASWPIERWGKYRDQYTYNCPSCRKEVSPLAYPVYTAINWANLGPTIGDRLAEQAAGKKGKALAPKTIERIKRGMAKFAGGPPVVIPGMGATTGITTPFAGNTHERPTQVRSKSLHSTAYTQHTTQAFGFAHTPFVTEMRGGGSVAAGQYPISRYSHGATAGGFHHGLVSPPAMFAKFNGGPADTSWHGVDEPANTITGRDTTGLVVLPWIDQYQSEAKALHETLGTVTTHQIQAYCAAESWNTWENITDDDLMNVHFRMFDPDPELRRIMAFADDYILLGNKGQMCAGLGNAVTPTVAEWITERSLATLRGNLQAYIPLASTN